MSLAVADSSIIEQDTIMQRINQLTKLVECGVLKKADMAPMMKAIYLGTTSTDVSPPSQDPVSKTVMGRGARYRRPASPETQKIRRIIEHPIERRFELQCATADSELFTSQPGSAQRRLNESLFSKAVEDPLENIYSNNAKELKRVPSEKVVHIIKWKVRKMRGNLVKKGVAKQGVYHDDGFDWEAAAETSPSRLVIRPMKERQYIQVKPKPLTTSTNLPLTKTPIDLSNPTLPHSTNGRESAFTVIKKKCGKCGKLSKPYPDHMNWSSNKAAIAYCQTCYQVFNKHCETLASAPKANEKKPKVSQKKTKTNEKKSKVSQGGQKKTSKRPRGIDNTTGPNSPSPTPRTSTSSPPRIKKKKTQETVPDVSDTITVGTKVRSSGS